MAPSHVVRVTMFKMPKEEDRRKLVGFYQVMKGTQKKDGKPYILSLEAGPVVDDPRSKGFTFASKTVFKDMADHAFYDTECPAHKALKKRVVDATLQVDEILTFFYEPEVVSSL